MFPKNYIFQTRSSTPVGDRVAQHNTKGPEGELLKGVRMSLRNERTTVVNHSDIGVVRLRCRGPEECGVSDNGICVHCAERMQVFPPVDEVATVQLYR